MALFKRTGAPNCHAKVTDRCVFDRYRRARGWRVVPHPRLGGGARNRPPRTCPRGADGARARLGRGRRECLVERGSLYLPDLVRLDQVAFLDVVVALEVDAALETLGHLAHVLLEAP